MFERRVTLKLKKVIEQQTDKIVMLQSDLSRARAEVFLLRTRLASREEREEDEDPPDWLLHLRRKAKGNFKGLPCKATVPCM